MTRSTSVPVFVCPRFCSRTCSACCRIDLCCFLKAASGSLCWVPLISSLARLVCCKALIISLLALSSSKLCPCSGWLPAAGRAGWLGVQVADPCSFCCLLVNNQSSCLFPWIDLPFLPSFDWASLWGQMGPEPEAGEICRSNGRDLQFSL